MYKLCIDKNADLLMDQTLRLSDYSFIPFDPANTDYQTFKADIEAGAELQDASGNVMTPDQVKEFVRTLP